MLNVANALYLPQWGESVGRNIQQNRLRARAEQKEVEQRNLLMQALPAAKAGDPNALATLYGVDPRIGYQIDSDNQQRAQLAAKTQREQTEQSRGRFLDETAGALAGVAQLPETEREAAWQQRQSGLMQKYPTFVDQEPDSWESARAFAPQLAAMDKRYGELLGRYGLIPKEAAEAKVPPLENWQNADGSINPELYEAEKALKTANTQLRIENPSAAATSPYYQAVPTPNGYMRFNARTGMMEPITVNGAVPQPIAADPTLKREMERAGAEGRTFGEATAEGVLTAPQAVARADQILSDIDNTLKAPGLDTAVGLSGTFDPRNYLPGTKARDAGVRIEQVQGQAFLQAFESLKGGGAITEREGQAATAAFARLNRAQSDSEFRGALGDLKKIIGVARERSVRKGSGVPVAPQSAAPSPQQSPTAPPSVDSILQKYGVK